MGDGRGVGCQCLFPISQFRFENLMVRHCCDHVTLLYDHDPNPHQIGTQTQGKHRITSPVSRAQQFKSNHERLLPNSQTLLILSETPSHRALRHCTYTHANQNHAVGVLPRTVQVAPDQTIRGSIMGSDSAPRHNTPTAYEEVFHP